MRLFSPQDEAYMQMAIDLAEKGRGHVSPNPLVGAVIVKDGVIVGSGYHARYGGRHAEAEAINQAGSSCEGADLYVTLEPCTHWGANPPCTRAIIDSGISRVVAAISDPNPLVSSNPAASYLAANQIKYDAGCLAKEVQKQNEAYLKYMTTGLPFVTIKSAISLDGKIASSSGDSKWISSSQSRRMVHQMRADSDVVLTGMGTVLKDDPLLTARELGFPCRQPARVVLDSLASLSLESKLIKSVETSPLIVFVGEEASPDNIKRLKGAGVQVITVAGKNTLDLLEVLQHLAKKKITSVMVEAGSTLVSGFVDSGLPDKLVLFIAPIIIGGQQPSCFISGKGSLSIADSRKLKDVSCQLVGGSNDYRYEAYF